ncbi:MAG: alpha-mannosidase [Actinomycetota bacterium]|nr:alpha-mannosidase [Actinomycetota bacterium]
MRRLLILPLLLSLLAPAPAAAAARGTVVPPRVAIFYYSWYSTGPRDGAYVHWAQNNRPAPFEIASNFYPARGVYSSSDPAVQRAQMREIRRAGVDQVIVSWWGTGSVEDLRLPAVLAAARRERLTVALHVEPYGGRTPATVAADIEHFRPRGITDFYVYDPLSAPAADWAVANAGLAGVRIFAGTGLAGFAATGKFTGLYTYDIVQYRAASFARICQQARAKHLLCAPSVGPGFDARRSTGATVVQPRRRGATYDGMWKAALNAAPDLVTITSYNEWHEGTQIEPARIQPVWAGYGNYEGAWGRRGDAAEGAYLWRTAMWSALFRS